MFLKHMSVVAAMDSMMPYNWITPVHVADFSKPKTRKTGKKHTQHCGERQAARYARQLAKGQLKFTDGSAGKSPPKPKTTYHPHTRERKER